MLSEPNVEFRSAKPEDAAMIRDVVRAAYARWVPVIGREPRPMAVDYDQAVREHWIDVISIGPRIVGLIQMMLREDHLWIENVAVRPEDQGRGLGRQLLAHAERRAIEAGCTETRLLTNAAFEANVALYERTGYVIVKREPFMGGTTVYMSKSLGRS
ncbi:GNAT family N-acetyltransferase [Microvirga sp. SYSU G3D207]|uniref:GNAT family N-acetyltransferase n=2 Tax=Microvirga arsenatis TaxID=2692265 RepID=A0ABW9Z232_9HYPH|nr:GNAT family N-acetyltransferase [Microvirga arsenatis]NBJ25780.1 GNAT family N-acetyltransferase [Microvirga arsenatis]